MKICGWAGPNHSFSRRRAHSMKWSRCRSRSTCSRPAARSFSKPYWRNGSSRRKRVPAGFCSATTTDLSTSPASDRMTSSASTLSPEHTRSAASRSNVPANTEARAHRICSDRVHRWKLQSTAACSVWWRGSPPRLPSASTRNVSSNLDSRWSSVSTRRRTAASSMANGIPPSSVQIWLTWWWFARRDGETRLDGGGTFGEQRQRPEARIASAGSGRTSSGNVSGATCHRCSPSTPRRSRLVTSTRRPGTPRSNASTRSAVASTTCSQLSSTISTCRSRRCSTRTVRCWRTVSSCTPNDSSTVCTTRSGSLTPASSTNHTPSRNARRSLAGRPQRQPGLADATDTREGDEARLGQQPSHLGDVVLAADESSCVSRQIAFATWGKRTAHSGTLGRLAEPLQRGPPEAPTRNTGSYPLGHLIRHHEP